MGSLFCRKICFVFVKVNASFFVRVIATGCVAFNLQIQHVILSYPRIIIDSWDYSDQLGVELVELAELYKKI